MREHHVDRPSPPADAAAREAATRQILEIIRRSREDERPVFDAILENASRLCQAPLAFLPMANEARTHVSVPAFRGVRPEFEQVLRQFDEPMTNTALVAVKCVAEGRIVQSPDLMNDPAIPPAGRWRRELTETEGARSVLVVPMMRGEIAIGAIMLYRREVAPFGEEDIALVETFAAQAVIAIENVRQFRALQIRLEREAATREILQVISRSRDDDAPVFDAILRNASRLCAAPFAGLYLVDEARSRASLVASLGTRSDYLERALTWWPLESGASVPRAISGRRVIHIGDLADTEDYRRGDRRRVEAVEIEGIRSFLAVPLLSEDGAVGCIGLYRREVAPFSDEQIALVETFAAQAVIAIENVRQFRALEELNASLEERVAAQVGEIERMGRLKRFLPPAVADAVVSTGDEGLLGSHRALIATLFCDIRGFTAFCETAEPEETIEVLQTYHEEMGVLIAAHGGGVDHRSGDGIMVIFNDPLPCDDPAGDALDLALAMRARMRELCGGWKRLGHRLGFGVGLSLGYATVGMVGSEGRYHYTASGTTVNLAARLCDEAGDGEILLSPRAAMAVEESVATEPVGELNLKGIQAAVQVFRVGAEASGT